MSVFDVTVTVTQEFPGKPEEAWMLVISADLVEVSQPWGPIPGVVEIREEEAGFPGKGLSRVLVNSDGSTVKERFVELDPPRLIEYTLTELTNAFRHITSGADAAFALEPAGSSTTTVTWVYTWHARNAWVWLPLWLVAHTAYRRYMRAMIRRMSTGTPRQGT